MVADSICNEVMDLMQSHTGTMHVPVSYARPSLTADFG